MTSFRALFLASTVVFFVACSSEPPPPATATGPGSFGGQSGPGREENDGGTGEPSPRVDGGARARDGGADAAPSCSCGTCKISPYGTPGIGIEVSCGIGVCVQNVLHVCTESCRVRTEKVASCDEVDGG